MRPCTTLYSQRVNFRLITVINLLHHATLIDYPRFQRMTSRTLCIGSRVIDALGHSAPSQRVGICGRFSFDSAFLHYCFPFFFLELEVPSGTMARIGTRLRMESASTQTTRRLSPKRLFAAQCMVLISILVAASRLYKGMEQSK
jgi:hypothetical protein